LSNKPILHFKQTDYYYAKTLCGEDHPEVHLLWPSKLKKHPIKEGKKQVTELIPPAELEQIEDYVRPERPNHNYREDSRKFRRAVNKQIRIFDKMKLEEDTAALIKKTGIKPVSGLTKSQRRNQSKRIKKLYKDINKLRYNYS